jgi:hypothetical protein
MRRYFTPSNAETILERAVRDEINVQNEQNIPPHEGSIAPSDEELNQSAWHGSGADFDAFSLAFMSTGEGTQAFGWGAYFAGLREVGEFYRETVTGDEDATILVDGEKAIPDNHGNWTGEKSGKRYVQFQDENEGHAITNAILALYGSKGDKQDAMDYLTRQKQTDAARIIAEGRVEYKERKGQLYEVNIPEDEDLLDLDKPLGKQPSKVIAALERLGKELGYKVGNFETHEKARKDFADRLGYSHEEALRLPSKAITALTKSNDFYKWLSDKFGGDKNASLKLLEFGIPGHRFLDGLSRDNGEGSHNYVIYDEKAIEIMRKYYQKKGNDTRGSFNPATLSIRLLENAGVCKLNCVTVF